MHSTIFTTLLLPLLTTALPQSLHGPPRLPSPFHPRQSNESSCDITNLEQPANTLSPPSTGLSLVLIAEGRGTQNYTCSAPTAAPSAIGAVASLFNASCSVASGSSPTSLGSLSEDVSAIAIGAHFFIDNTTPEFDIIGLGNTLAEKVENMTAPDAGNVPWLKLNALVEQSDSAVREIYRLNTVGGVAPKTCEGIEVGGTVEVEYTTQYWFYASTEVVERRRRRALGMVLE